MTGRVLTWVLTLCAVGVVPVAASQPAVAAACPAPALVYADAGFQTVIKTENDPINGKPVPIATDAPTGVLNVTLGGEGLLPGTSPSWDIVNPATGAYLGTVIAPAAGTDCASAKRNYPIRGAEGDTFLFKASYMSGSSGARIGGQSHFLAVFF